MTLINYWRSSSLLFHLGNHAKWLSYASVSIDSSIGNIQHRSFWKLQPRSRYGTARLNSLIVDIMFVRIIPWKRVKKRWKGRPPPLAQRSPVTAHINFNLVSPNLLNPPCDIFTLKCTRTKASGGEEGRWKFDVGGNSRKFIKHSVSNLISLAVAFPFSP